MHLLRPSSDNTILTHIGEPIGLNASLCSHANLFQKHTAMTLVELPATTGYPALEGGHILGTGLSNSQK